MAERNEGRMPHKKIMAVVAHPDDETYATGMLGKAVKAGHEVVLVAVTPGDLGGRTRSNRKVAKRRTSEFAQAAGLIGASGAVVLGHSEGRFDPLKAQRNLIAVTRDVNPDVVVTHASDDYHLLHRKVSEAAEWAAFTAPATPYRTRSLKFPWHIIPAIPNKEIALYEMSSQGSKNRLSTHDGYNEDNITVPGLIVNLSTDEFALKPAVYDTHHSQKKLQLAARADWDSRRVRELFDEEISVEGLGHVPFVDQLKLQASALGEIAGFSFGEGYFQVSYGGEAFTTRNMLHEMFPGEVYDIAKERILV